MIPIALTLLSFALLEPCTSLQEDGEAASEPKWEGTLNAGLSTSSGNTDHRSLHTSMEAEIREAERRYSLGFHWQYADEAQDGPRELLERHADANAQVDFFIDEKSYYLVTSDAETDHQAELESRYSAGLGYGYQVAEEEDGYLSGRFGYTLEKGLGERWTLSQDSEIFPSFEEAEDVHVEVDTRLRCDLSDNLYGQFQWIFDWDNTPATDAERDDHRLLFSVGYSF